MISLLLFVLLAGPVAFASDRDAPLAEFADIISQKKSVSEYQRILSQFFESTLTPLVPGFDRANEALYEYGLISGDSVDLRQMNAYLEKRDPLEQIPSTFRFEFAGDSATYMGIPVAKEFLTAFIDLVPETGLQGGVVDRVRCQEINYQLQWARLIGLEFNPTFVRVADTSEAQFRRWMQLLISVGTYANSRFDQSCTVAQALIIKMWPGLVGIPWSRGVRITSTSYSMRHQLTLGFAPNWSVPLRIKVSTDHLDEMQQAEIDEGWSRTFNKIGEIILPQTN